MVCDILQSFSTMFAPRPPRNYPDPLCARYKLSFDEIETAQGYEILELVGRKRGMLISGGEINTERAASAVLDEFRGAVLGKLTIDRAEDHPDVRI